MKVKGMKWFASLLIVVLITGLFPVGGISVGVVHADEPDQLFDGGTGTAEDPYLIRTMEQFDKIRFVHTENKYFKLVNDITVSEFSESWDRISSIEDIPSQLTLDGNGHTITLDKLSLSETKDPLFDSLGSNSVIKNLLLEYITPTDVAGTEAYAPLAINNEGSIYNVHVRFRHALPYGFMYASDESFAGFVINNEQSGNIQYSSAQLDALYFKGSNIANFVLNNEGTITQSFTEYDTRTGPGNGITSFGGFVGNNSGLIDSSYSNGAANIRLAEVSGKSAAFVANNEQSGSISNSYAAGGRHSTSFKLVEPVSVGGFAADNAGIIQQSYTKIDLMGQSSQSVEAEHPIYFGGFVGRNAASGEIREAYELHSFSGIYGQVGNINNVKKHGGFSGENIGTVEHSYYKEEAYSEYTHVENGALSEDAFRVTTNFVDWDFDNLWEIVSDSPTFKKKINAVHINESNQRMNLGSTHQFTVSKLSKYPPFLDITEELTWSIIGVGDESITVVDGLVTISPNAVPGIYTLRVELASDASIYDETTFIIVQPNVLGFVLNDQYSTLNAIGGAGQGGTYTVAFDVEVEGGAGQEYIIEPAEPDYITLSKDASELFYNVNIAEDAPLGSYTLLVESLWDSSKSDEYEFQVVAPYREVIGLKQNDVVVGNNITHLVYGDQTYELAIINHGSQALVSTTTLAVSSTGDGMITPIEGVGISNNKITIAEELKATITEDYNSIYLYVGIQEDPSINGIYELKLSNARFDWSYSQEVSEIYHVAGETSYTGIDVVVFGVEQTDNMTLNLVGTSDHPGIVIESLHSTWMHYVGGYHVSASFRINNQVPEGDYTITISLDDPAIKLTIPVYVREEIIKSISLDSDKIFIPKNLLNYWGMTNIPIEIELADDIANLELAGLQSFINLYDSNGSQFMNINGSIVEIEDQLYLSFLIPYYDNSIPLGTVLDAEVGLMIEPSKLAELQVVFGEIDDIEFDGLELTDNYLELYAFAGDSIMLNPTVKSTNHTVEGFPVPQNITWTLYGNDAGVSLSENGVFTLNEPKNDYYNVSAVAEGGLNANITIAVARVALVSPAKDTVHARPGSSVDFEVQVKTNHQNFYSTTEFTWYSEELGITYEDGQVVVDEDVELGTYTMTFTSTRDTTKSANVTVQVGGPSAVEVQPDSIVVMPGGAAILDTEFSGHGEFTQSGVWDTKGIAGLTVEKLAEQQYQLSVADNVQPADYTITYSHDEYDSIATDVTVQVYNITGITDVQDEYHLNQGQQLTLDPSVVAVNAANVVGIDELDFESSNTEAFTVDEHGKISVKPNAVTGKYELTITSAHKESVQKTVVLHVTSIDAVTVTKPVDSPLAYQVGESIQLSAEVEVTGQVSDGVNWTSSNPAMVSVDSTGLVTIKAGAEPGIYTVTATSEIDDRRFDSVEIEVGEVTAIIVDKEAIYLQAGEETTLTASADVIGSLSTEVEWGSDDPELTVSQQGEIMVAATAEPGTYTVTVTSAINEQVHKNVTVEVFEIQSIEITAIPSIYKGTSYELEYDVVVAGKHGDRIIDKVFWSIYDHEGDPVAGITVDEDNIIHVSSSVVAGKYDLSADSSVNPEVSRNADLYITSIDGVQINQPSQTVLQAGESIALTAEVMVTGDVSKGVDWTVEGPSALVKIDADGELTVLEGATTGDYTVIVTSSVDESQYGTTIIEVAEVIEINLDQVKVALQPGQSITVTGSAIVDGDLSTNVTWSSEDEEITVDNGTITVDSEATAGNYTVKVSSVANTDVTANVTVQVFRILGIDFLQDEFTLNQGKTAELSYTVESENSTDVEGVDDIRYQFQNSNVTVDDNGHIVVGENVAAGTYTITVRSVLDETVSRDIQVHVTSIDSVTIDELSQVVLQAGESITLQAQVAVTGQVDDDYVWSIVGPSELVTIDEQGKLIVAAGAQVGDYTVTATSTVDARRSSSVTIEVAEVTAITVDQAKLALQPEQSITVTGSAIVDGNLNTNVTWSSEDEEITVENGTITVDAEAAAGTYQVKVASIANSSVSELITVQVYHISGIELAKNEFTLNQGKREAFSYVVQKQNADDVEGVDNVVYDSEHEDIYVNENGELVVGDNVEAGTYTITVQSTLNQAASSDFTVHVTSINAVTATPNELSLYPGDQAEVAVSVEVSGEVSDAIVWESNSPSIEIVELEEKGKVTIKAAGSTTVGTYTVKAYSEVDERKFAEIKVKVSRRSSPSPDPIETPSPEEPSLTDPETTPAPTEPAPTETPADATQVLKSELINMTELVTAISERLAAASFPKFADMEGHWADDVVTKAAQLGITNGYQDGSFKPNASITRAEFVKMLANILPVQTPSEVKSFNDITTHWAKNEIELFASLGIINGYGNGSFSPNQTITREEMVLIVTRLLSLSNVAKDFTRGQFSDLYLVSGYAQQVVVEAAQAGIINGKSNNMFAPKADATRAEALSVIMNALSLDPELAKLLK